MNDFYDLEPDTMAINNKTKYIPPNVYPWEKWFAWYPVYLWQEEKYAFLKFVLRREKYYAAFDEYIPEYKEI